MSIVLECTIPSGGFLLGEVLSGHGDVQYELERIVPTGGQVMPFVWVTGEERTAFEESVRSHSAVADLCVLDDLGERGLYRIDWNGSPTEFLQAIEDAEATVLSARGGDEWFFQIRFPVHDRLSAFHEDVRERGIPVDVDRTIPLSELEGGAHRFDLTSDQREALRLALREGYFATPRTTNLEDLADALDISRQATSRRIRRGNEKVLRRIFPAVGNSVPDRT